MFYNVGPNIRLRTPEIKKEIILFCHIDLQCL